MMSCRLPTRVVTSLIMLFITNVCLVAEPVTEVVLIGTQHFISDMPEGYTPAHLRALLNKVSPAAVMVETWKQDGKIDWSAAPFELWNITKPWAENRKTPFVAVNENYPTYSQELEQFFQAMRAKDGGAAYQKVETSFQLTSAKLILTCEYMNSAAHNKLWREYHAELHQLYGQETAWEKLNAKVVKNILAACREYRGRRVAVVYGAAHVYYFADQLALDSSIRLIPTSTFFPLSNEELNAATVERDYAFALRQLNFESLDPSALPGLEIKLEKLTAYPSLKNDYRFFKGKLLMHKGKYADAETEFNALSSANAADVLVFDNTSNVRNASRVYAAIARGKAGDWKTAKSELTKLLKEDTSPELKAWIHQILLQQPEQPHQDGGKK